MTHNTETEMVRNSDGTFSEVEVTTYFCDGCGREFSDWENCRVCDCGRGL